MVFCPLEKWAESLVESVISFFTAMIASYYIKYGVFFCRGRVQTGCVSHAFGFFIPTNIYFYLQNCVYYCIL